MALNPQNLEYKNLRGLLVLCCAARLVDIDPEKRTWRMSKKFADILYHEMPKPPENIPPPTNDKYDSYVASDSPPEGMAGDSLGNPEE